MTPCPKYLESQKLRQNLTAASHLDMAFLKYTHCFENQSVTQKQLIVQQNNCKLLITNLATKLHHLSQAER